MGSSNNTVWVWVGCFYSTLLPLTLKAVWMIFVNSLVIFICNIVLQYIQHGAGTWQEACPFWVCGTGVDFSTDVCLWSERPWGKTKAVDVWCCGTCEVGCSRKATDSKLCSNHAKQVTIISEHIQLACCTLMLKNPL